jgi:hypothetical protein
MHLVIDAALGGDLDEAWREHCRDRGRGEQHLAEQLERFGLARHRDRTHVPDHLPFGVEIGGADQKPAALAMLGGNLGQEFFGHIEGDDPGEGRVACKRVAAEQSRTGWAMAMSLVVDWVKTCFSAASYFGPRNANGAVSAPVETPVTRSNSGRVPEAVQPPSRPAPNAPSLPPPDSARKLTTGRLPPLTVSGRLARTCAHYSFTS